MVRLGFQESVRLDFRFIPDEGLPTYYEVSDILVYIPQDGDHQRRGDDHAGPPESKRIVTVNPLAFQGLSSDKETSLFVGYGDVDALATTLTRLIRDPKERERLAFGVASSDDFNSWTLIARRKRQCYASVLQLARQEAISW